jgi:hypothetical protein
MDYRISQLRPELDESLMSFVRRAQLDSDCTDGEAQFLAASALLPMPAWLNAVPSTGVRFPDSLTRLQRSYMRCPNGRSSIIWGMIAAVASSASEHRGFRRRVIRPIVHVA